MSSAAIACEQTVAATENAQSAAMAAWRIIPVSMIVFPTFLYPPQPAAVNRKRHGVRPGKSRLESD
jgi:hypothetical protein